jgi:hypothetical protein
MSLPAKPSPRRNKSASFVFIILTRCSLTRFPQPWPDVARSAGVFTFFDPGGVL